MANQPPSHLDRRLRPLLHQRCGQRSGRKRHGLLRHVGFIRLVIAMKDTRHTLVQLLFPVARAMLAATFIISALRHLTHWSAALDEMAGDGIPRSSFLLTGSIALRLIGGLSILLGFHARIG